MNSVNAFGRGFVSGFTDWPFIICAGVLYLAFKAAVSANPNAYKGSSFWQRPSTSFFGAVVAIVLLDVVPWWGRVLALFLILLTTVVPDLALPVLGGYAYLTWQNVAPGTSVAGHILLLAIWETFLFLVIIGLKAAVGGTSPLDNNGEEPALENDKELPAEKPSPNNWDQSLSRTAEDLDLREISSTATFSTGAVSLRNEKETPASNKTRLE